MDVRRVWVADGWLVEGRDGWMDGWTEESVSDGELATGAGAF